MADFNELYNLINTYKESYGGGVYNYSLDYYTESQYTPNDIKPLLSSIKQINSEYNSARRHKNKSLGMKCISLMSNTINNLSSMVNSMTADDFSGNGSALLTSITTVLGGIGGSIIGNIIGNKNVNSVKESTYDNYWYDYYIEKFNPEGKADSELSEEELKASYAKDREASPQKGKNKYGDIRVKFGKKDKMIYTNKYPEGKKFSEMKFFSNFKDDGEDESDDKNTRRVVDNTLRRASSDGKPRQLTDSQMKAQKSRYTYDIDPNTGKKINVRKQEESKRQRSHPLKNEDDRKAFGLLMNKIYKNGNELAKQQGGSGDAFELGITTLSHDELKSLNNYYQNVPLKTDSNFFGRFISKNKETDNRKSKKEIRKNNKKNNTNQKNIKVNTYEDKDNQVKLRNGIIKYEIERRLKNDIDNEYADMDPSRSHDEDKPQYKEQPNQEPIGNVTNNTTNNEDQEPIGNATNNANNNKNTNSKKKFNGKDLKGKINLKGTAIGGTVGAGIGAGIGYGLSKANVNGKIAFARVKNAIKNAKKRLSIMQREVASW